MILLLLNIVPSLADTEFVGFRFFFLLGLPLLCAGLILLSFIEGTGLEIDEAADEISRPDFRDDGFGGIDWLDDSLLKRDLGEALADE